MTDKLGFSELFFTARGDARTPFCVANSRDANGERWRKRVGEIVSELNYPNVTYINGLDVIGDMSYMSADEVHPNIYGVQRIADVLTEKIRCVIKKQ